MDLHHHDHREKHSVVICLINAKMVLVKEILIKFI